MVIPLQVSGKAGEVWERGPFHVDELRDLLSPDWVPSRRFGVYSTGKFRLIDDSSAQDAKSNVALEMRATMERSTLLNVPLPGVRVQSVPM